MGKLKILGLSAVATTMFFMTGCNGNSNDTEATGIMNDLAVADVLSDGWTECHKSSYADGGYDLTILRTETCSGDEIMLTCRETDSPTLRVAAYADHDDVFFDTSGGENLTHTANGVDWYFYEDMSMGFTPIDVPIYLDTADGYDADGGPEGGDWDTLSNNQKLSWHTNAGELDDGWRCGTESFLGNGWERIIYQRNK